MSGPTVFLLFITLACSQAEEPSADSTEDRLRGYVEYLLDEGGHVDRQNVATTAFITESLDFGVENVPTSIWVEVERFVTEALDRVGEDSSEDVRVRAGLAIRLAPYVPTAEVRGRLHAALELNVDRMPWPDEFFATLRRMKMTETLGHFEGLADEFGGLSPEELSRARFPYPVSELISCLASLGGDAEVPRLSCFVRDGVAPTLQCYGIDALSKLEGKASLDLLCQLLAKERNLNVRRRLGKALAERGQLQGLELLLRLNPEGRDLQGWLYLELAANRSFETTDHAESWLKESEGAGLEERRLREFQRAGYRVGDLTAVEQLDELLRAASDDSELIVRNAWKEFVIRAGVDPSRGGFWTAILISDERGAYPKELRYGDRPWSAEDLGSLREQQSQHISKAREWLDEVRENLQLDSSGKKFLVEDEGEDKDDG